MATKQLFRGKLPARANAIKFQFGDYLNADALPPMPAGEFGHVTNTMSWGMLGNDQAGDCVMAGGAHETIVWHQAAWRPAPRFTTQSTLADYSRALVAQGGAPFDPNNRRTDAGLDMQQTASWRRTVGITDADGYNHKISGYATTSSWDMMMQGVRMFGAVGLGLQLPDSAEDMFTNGQTWTVSGPAGAGHYVPVVGRNSKGNAVVITWGRLQDLDQEFWDHYADEVCVYFSLDYLRSTGLSPEAFNEKQLEADLASIK